MRVTRDEVLAIIYQCIDELNELLAPERQLPKTPDTSFFADAGGLDSLGFVNFIALVEQKCENRFRVALTLTDDTNEDGGIPFDTVDGLADLIWQLLKNRKVIDG
jgi:acyl carrier protein